MDIKWAPVGATQIEAVVPLRTQTVQQNAADVADFKRMLQGSGGPGISHSLFAG